MHRASYNLMEDFAKTYLDALEVMTIYDIGSQGVSSKNGKNGTYHNIFNIPNWKYIGVDIVEGPNVTHVLDEPYKWDIESDTADVVISGQCLEHIEYPWLTFGEMVRILKPGGAMCIIVPTAGREHKHPLDCWRILPDGMNALCRMFSMEVEYCGVGPKSDHKWRDCQLIAYKPKE